MKIHLPSKTQCRHIFASLVLASVAGCQGDSSNDPTLMEESDSVVNVDVVNVDSDDVDATDNEPPRQPDPTGLVRIELNRVVAEARLEEETFLNVNGVSNGSESSERIETFTIEGCSTDDVFFLSNDLRDNSSTIAGYIEVFAGTCIKLDTPTPNPSPANNVLGDDNWFLFVTTQSNTAPETEQNALVDLRSGSEDVYSVNLPDTDQLTFVQDVRFGEVFAERLFFGQDDNGGQLVDDRVTNIMTFTWSIGFDDCTFSGYSTATRCTELEGL